MMDLSDAQLLRYSRHILLNEIGVEGQAALCNAHVLLVGAGGLGCAAALYLASSGVGRITVLDDDVVDLTNLQRQVAHETASVGLGKAVSLKQRLQAINPEVQVLAIAQRADAQGLHALLPSVDVVLDCSDNFATRHIVNATCVQAQVPLVSGSALKFDGQWVAFDMRAADCPCYACVFPAQAAPTEAQCATMGVFAPVVGMVGTAQAAAALHIALGNAGAVTGHLHLLDAHSLQWHRVQIKRSQQCSVCGSDHRA